MDLYGLSPKWIAHELHIEHQFVHPVKNSVPAHLLRGAVRQGLGGSETMKSPLER
jgi:hypothetical protein